MAVAQDGGLFCGDRALQVADLMEDLAEILLFRDVAVGVHLSLIHI